MSLLKMKDTIDVNSITIANEYIFKKLITLKSSIDIRNVNTKIVVRIYRKEKLESETEIMNDGEYTIFQGLSQRGTYILSLIADNFRMERLFHFIL